MGDLAGSSAAESLGELERDPSTREGSGEQVQAPEDVANLPSIASDPGAWTPCLHTRHIIDKQLPSGEIVFACSECGTALALEARP